jgi:hypothetical protein
MNPELINADVIALLEDYAPNSYFTEDREGDPFFIVEGWEELGGIQRALNEVHAPYLWGQWKPAYDKRNAECEYDWEKSGGRAYQSLTIHYIRLGDDIPAVRGGSLAQGKEMYGVPEGLIELDSVCEWGFSDEYIACGVCSKAICTTPGYHGEQMYGYYTDEGDVFCGDCTRDDPEQYFEDMKNKNKLVNENVCNPENDGWIDLELSYENGLHSGQNDSPELLLKLRERLLPFADFVFTGDVGQFDVAWTIWVKPVEFAWEDRGGWVDLPEIFSEICRRMISRGYKTPATGPSDYAKAALRSTPVTV